jgi:L-lactate dehydrogenase complex protein LldF
MPSLAAPAEAAHAGELAGASTFCGRCDSVCPVEIPLVDIMRRRRDTAFAGASFKKRSLMRAWAALALHPRAYHVLARIGIGLLRLIAPRQGAFSRLSFASAWTRYRDFPAPQGPTFQHLWAKRPERAQP